MPEFTSRLAEMKDVALDTQEADLKAFDQGGGESGIDSLVLHDRLRRTRALRRVA